MATQRWPWTGRRPRFHHHCGRRPRRARGPRWTDGIAQPDHLLCGVQLRQGGLDPSPARAARSGAVDAATGRTTEFGVTPWSQNRYHRTVQGVWIGRRGYRLATVSQSSDTHWMTTVTLPPVPVPLPPAPTAHDRYTGGWPMWNSISTSYGRPQGIGHGNSNVEPK